MARIVPFRRPRPTSPAPLAGQAAGADTAGGRGQAPAAGAPLRPADAQRFRALILPHLDDAYSFARYLARDPSLAEDIVQDAFLKAVRAFPGYRGGDARAWLFAIVRTTFLSAARGAPPRPDPGAGELLASDGDTPEMALLRQADIGAVRGAIEALPEPFRETLVLRELEEMSYRQIADITSAPIGTVMSRLSRARQMLLAALSEEAGA